MCLVHLQNYIQFLVHRIVRIQCMYPVCTYFHEMLSFRTSCELGQVLGTSAQFSLAQVETELELITWRHGNWHTTRLRGATKNVVNWWEWVQIYDLYFAIMEESSYCCKPDMLLSSI